MANNITLQVGVKALLKNKDNKFLLLKRSKLKYPDIKDGWDIVGGRIDPGTNLVDNLKREIMEETGLELKHHPMLVSAQDILMEDRHVVRLTYVAPIEGEPVLSDEHDEFGWFTPEEIEKLEGLDKYLAQLFRKAKEIQ